MMLKSHAGRWSAVVAVAAAIFSSNAPTGAAGDTPASFTIDPVSGATVASDGGSYVDFRLIDGGASSPPICVDSLITTGGTVFNRLNREVAPDLRCGAVGGTARNFRIYVGNPLACAELDFYGVGLTDPSGAPWTGSGDCILRDVDSPRIRVDKTFGSRVTKTKLAFLITMLDAPAGHGGFEIQPKTAAVVRASGAARIVEYAGEANLVKFGTNKPAPVEGADFILKFQITFTPGA